MGKTELGEWIKCNLLEIIILILVLILVINTFSKEPATQIEKKESKEEISAPQEGISAENQSKVLEQPQEETPEIRPKENVSEELKGNETPQVPKETIKQGVEKGSNTTR